MASFTLKQDEQNFFTLTVLSKAFPAAFDSWDGNLIRTRVDYAIRGVLDSYEARLFTTDIESFRDELAGDVVDDTGIIALTTIDGVVYIEMERMGRSFLTHCSLSKVPDGVEDARLELQVPISAASAIVSELDTILMHYPVLGPCTDPEPGELSPPSRN